MAVPKNKKTRSKRNMHRSHDGLKSFPFSVDPMTGESHRRHHIGPDGYYRGREVLSMAESAKEE